MRQSGFANTLERALGRLPGLAPECSRCAPEETPAARESARFRLCRRDHVALAFLAVLVLTLRLDQHVSTGLSHPMWPDSGRYVALGKTLRIMSPHRTPVYPWFLGVTFRLFGTDNYAAVAALQTAVGILASLAIYVILRAFVHHRGLAFAGALLNGFDLHAAQFEMVVLTEALSSSLVVFTLLVMLHPGSKGRSWRWTILLNVCFLVLVFLRPVFIALLPILPILGGAESLRERSWRPLRRMATVSLLVLLIPLEVWCLNAWKRYGFWSLSNRAPLGALGFALQSGLWRNAPSEYDGERDLIEEWLQNGGTGNPNEIRGRLLDFMRQTRSPRPEQPRVDEDWSPLGEFVSACARNNPGKFAAQVATNVVRLTCAHSYGYGAKDFLASRPRRGSLLSQIHVGVYWLAIRPLHASGWGLAMLIVASGICLATAFCTAWGMVTETVGLLCVPWAHLLLSAPFSYSDMGRYRTVIDSVIFMVGFIALVRLVQLWRALPQQRRPRSASPVAVGGIGAAGLRGEP